MKDISIKNEVARKPRKETMDLKAKERRLVKELLLKQKETSVQTLVEKEIRQFESIRRKEMSDYSLFIIKLNSIKDQLEYRRDTVDGSTDKLAKEISNIEKLIEKYRKEQICVCMQRSEDVLDQSRKVRLL